MSNLKMKRKTGWKRSRRGRIVIAITMLIPATIILYIIVTLRLTASTMNDSKQIILEQSQNSVERYTKHIEQVARSMVLSVYDTLQDTDSENQLEEYRSILYKLQEYEDLDEVLDATLYVPDTKIYSSGSPKIQPISYLSDFYGYNITSPGVYWNGIDYVITNDEEMISTVSCLVVYADTRNYDKLMAAIKINVDVSDIVSLVYSNEELGYEVFLTDENGRNMADPDEVVDLNSLTEKTEDGVAKLSIGGEMKRVVSAKNDKEGWYVFVCESGDYFNISGNTVGLISIIVLILIEVVLLLIASFNFMIESSVKRLIEIAEAIEQVKAPSRATEFGKIEKINVLGLKKSVDKAAHQVMQLIDEQYRSQIKARDFQMKALRAQINPHFLYNTLDVIKWQILADDKESSVFMISALSKHFRLSLNKGKDIVCMKDELELIKTYISIMERRFVGRFTAEYDIEEDIGKCLIPKLSLQPIVENAFLHGILESEKKNSVIFISANIEDEQVVIEITDNGVGMDEETKKKLYEPNNRLGGYGLKNVRERILLFGGEKAEFNIKSSLGVGTTVEIRFWVSYSHE